MSQESEYAEAIVDRDDDDAFFGQSFAVVEEHFAGAAGVSTARNINKNRQAIGEMLRGRPDVEKQAVFADVIAEHVLFGPGTEGALVRLHWAGAKRIGMADTLPGVRRLRRLPTERANG